MDDRSCPIEPPCPLGLARMKLMVIVKKPLNWADFKNAHSGGFQAMMLDSSVRFIKSQTPESRIRTLLSIAGDEETEDRSY